MGVKIAGNCLHWSQPWLSHCSSSPQTLASIVSSVSAAKRRGAVDGCDPRSLTYQIFHQTGRRSPFLGTTRLSRRRSFDNFKGCGRISRAQFLGQAFIASIDRFGADDDEQEFVKRLQELALKLQDCTNNVEEAPHSSSNLPSVRKEMNPSAEPPWHAICPEPPKWINSYDIVPPCLEMNANCVDLPPSLRIIKQKKRWEEGFRESGESAYCSIKKAFSSMVFIVCELQSYTLHMREALFYENLEGILARVQGEMNASFVWVFQQIFSCTPTFMVYVMLLLANFTVYSIGHNSTIAAVSPNSPAAVEQEYQQTEKQNSRFDVSSIKSFNVVRRTASVGGSSGGGGKVKLVAGASDEGGSHSSYTHRVIPADGISTTSTGVGESKMVVEEEEMDVWRRIVEEATKMQASLSDETLMDSDTLQQLVSPVTVELEAEDSAQYSETELMYHKALSQDPDNVLLLSNFAQFLFLVLHDHDRAEYYFKQAAEKKPGDAEALCQYAMFLWLVRKDLEAAEEAYLEAIAADPSNTHYTANYAHFLWNTGAEDACYPLDGSDAC